MFSNIYREFINVLYRKGQDVTLPWEPTELVRKVCEVIWECMGVCCDLQMQQSRLGWFRLPLYFCCFSTCPSFSFCHLGAYGPHWFTATAGTDWRKSLERQRQKMRQIKWKWSWALKIYQISTSISDVDKLIWILQYLFTGQHIYSRPPYISWEVALFLLELLQVPVTRKMVNMVKTENSKKFPNLRKDLIYQILLDFWNILVCDNEFILLPLSLFF